MPCKADVIVMEIFDSMLLGEGVLSTMSDARKRLLADGGKVVPSRGVLSGVLVDSPWLERHTRFENRSPVPWGELAGNNCASQVRWQS